jgi:DNA-directed RNA polymerase subunit M/transcription elongation factor TFIIS
VAELPKPPADPPNCEKCGQPTALLTVIQRLGDEPGYRLFQCEACNVLQWVAEQIVGGDKSG